MVNEHVLYDNGEQGWLYHRTRTLFRWKTEQYSSLEAATEAAERILAEEANREAMQESTRLRQRKKHDSLKRLSDEEAQMREEAKSLWANKPRPSPENIEIDPTNPKAIRLILEKLSEMPYLRHIWVDDYWPGSLYFSQDGFHWKPDPEFVKAHLDAVRKRAREIAKRAEIAEAWGIDPRGRWNEIKAKVRRHLKPRANELLEQASVKRLLDEALARGCKAILYQNIMFWYEEKELHWEIKEAQRAHDAARGNSLWIEGKIISKNHGRIIILPYIKEDGTKNNGHTKNAPGDGPALPRHPADYVEIPFEIYNGDLMIGLKGELPYE
ncbi:hypothetical protein D187_006716 [Cystobacter fuscus DSM 2262]|uniref:Uncharacterized protein n=1 Tax=Cystobacter fuscus (strain ATCC 25194 / DSM 2262 / NBRC 100088 / M29) TaxID=1242864 RepID=S9P3Y4_CYSF2|nr:hypothetical protein D187_006716 [Cystobacter fuscus DSM 2262]